ncbi:phage terminase large subunit [Sulfitobacter pseudonitzschiae]|uniref:Phage terminase large subunit n=1 Tax=Pseudosulfitobacter pseudonitzschiae TaxID=1402135 RepID=A0A9Q2P4M4_9RHOB|nr:phage terminase large subunit [Pseudosulfitobacter pseudonitzschiae]MBM2293761.1 phage terminase large subunit [Pseudosulfitobacter pseudonitzschiae]MBM2298679.1 phage terminase large subunit [Pseudosulfitobacter pseudonitzschiae]MBM2303593.1 phage terminase large subunit [Pseudosulfitobacter pseudonitzschiae]MBM2313376.1 phage terminase large subunit [Pseudosulfitobacter pseudonitzschiae]MBM2318289.1 phage terminase large subunit [Pseudosulfitobacter pseudonitzschiae]
MNRTDLLNVDREIAKRSLSEFVQMGWPVLEPAEVYKHNWHMDALSDHLMAAAAGDSAMNRLLINVPPGTSKSSKTSVFFPAWLWGPFGAPNIRFIGAAHEQGLATRDNRRTRLLVESDWYQERWPTKITSDQNEKTLFENDKRGFRQSSAVAGMTGKRGHFVVWDDPQNPESANSDVSRETSLRIFRETLPSRLVDPINSVIIIIMQRLNQDDVSGYILANELGYQHLMLPMEFEPHRRCYTVVKPTHFKSEKVRGRYLGAKQRWFLEGDEVPDDLAPVVERLEVQEVYNQDPREEDGELLFEDRFPRSVVDRDKKVMGEYATAGQLQQRPAPREGGMFKTADFEIVDAIPHVVAWVRAWDLAATKVNRAKRTKGASKAAFTAGVAMGKTADGRYIIADVNRFQENVGKVETKIVNTAGQDVQRYKGIRGSLPKDPGAGGKAWATTLITKLAGFSYRATPEDGDKVSRAQPLAAQVENGNVMLLRGAWNKDFLDEIGLFPASKYKDQVDAATRAFAELVNAPTFEWYVSGDDDE